MNDIKHLMINSELYAPIFMTNNNASFDMIKNHMKLIVPKSKTKEFYHNFQQILFIYQEYYTKAIDHTKLFLQQNNLEKEVFWFNKNAVPFPCGYYQIGIAYLSNQKGSKNQELTKEITEYIQEASDFLKTPFFLQYDYLTNAYGIALKGNQYEELTLAFNSFVDENGLGPFQNIKEVSIYGEINGKNYPRLAKRK